MMYSRGFSFTPIVIFLIVALLMAAFLGTAIADTDFLNSATHQAKARRLDAETAYQQQLWALELKAQEAQHAKKLELMEHDAQLKAELFEVAVLVGLGIGSVAVLVLSGALAWYIACRGYVWMVQGKQQRAAAPERGVLIDYARDILSGKAA
ncbi:MAG TPA: hypothetical protein EYP49_14290 [Anaerolineae bacterium]|nr:hypothetical protein [Anaerolineae bacterium]